MEQVPHEEHGEPGAALRRLVDELGARAHLPAHVRPATAAAVVLCTLAARLTRGQAHQLLAALPTPLQPLLASCVLHRYGPVADLDDAGFLDRIADRLDVSPAHAEVICDAVFRAVAAELPAQILEHVAAQLPRDMRDLWRGTRPLAEVTAPPPETARHQLLAEIEDRATLPLGVTARDAFAAVMCTFSQRLSGGEARDVFLGLPAAVRPLIERCITHRDEEGAVFDRAQLVSGVADELGTPPMVAEQIVVVVLGALKRLLPAKEVRDVARQLPADLGALWDAAT